MTGKSRDKPLCRKACAAYRLSLRQVPRRTVPLSWVKSAIGMPLRTTMVLFAVSGADLQSSHSHNKRLASHVVSIAVGIDPRASRGIARARLRRRARPRRRSAVRGAPADRGAPVAGGRRADRVRGRPALPGRARIEARAGRAYGAAAARRVFAGSGVCRARDRARNRRVDARVFRRGAGAVACASQLHDDEASGVRQPDRLASRFPLLGVRAPGHGVGVARARARNQRERCAVARAGFAYGRIRAGSVR
ncbi:Uncharacterised protein [Burkholderia cenocepacia]|nr:Uncharacterised protein [Burkholderia cenocepacia]